MKKAETIMLVLMLSSLLIFATTGIFAFAEDEDARFPLDGEFEEALQVDEPGHLFKHGGTVTFTLSTDEKRSGESSLLVTGRGLPYSGPGWGVKDYLKEVGAGNWYIDAYVKKVSSEPMTMYFAIYLKLEDGTEDWLTCNNSFVISADEWTQVNAGFTGGSALLRSSKDIDHDFQNVEVATMYMCTGEGQLGDFYIDDVKLWRGSDEVDPPGDTPAETNYEFFPLDGSFEEDLMVGVDGHLFRHGGACVFSLSEDEAFEGSRSLKVSERDLTYSGAGWIITGYLKQIGWGDIYFSAYGKTVEDSLLGITYKIYMQFNDGKEDWLSVGRQTYLSRDTWTRINVDSLGNPGQMRSDTGSIPNFENLKYAVLYPETDDGQFGDYYLDEVKLWRGEESPTESEIVVSRPDITPSQPQDNKDTNNKNLIPVIIIVAIVVLGGTITGWFVYKKKRTEK